MYTNVHGHLHSKVRQRVPKITPILRYYSKMCSVRSRASYVKQQQQQHEPLRVTLGRSIDEAGSQAVGYRVASRMHSISASNGGIRSSSSVRFRSLEGYRGGCVGSTMY